MRFTKMEGLGNDFVVVEEPPSGPSQVRTWCDHRRGIGADGVLAVDSKPSMEYWNADGSPAEMCGNGLRCVARYSVDRGWSEEGSWFSIMTPVGPRQALVEGDVITVEIGPVSLGESIEVDGALYRRASLGNPHAVRVVDDPETVEVALVGRAVAAAPAFPDGANVEFVALSSPGRIRMRVWERGVGETLACGTGMVAAAAVAAGTDGDPVEVEVPGGRARVTFRQGSGYLTGPAGTVFSGEIESP